MRNITLPITGMHCASCAASITAALKRLPGVSAIEVNPAANTAAFSYDENAVTMEKIKDAIRSVGYGVGETAGRTETDDPESRTLRRDTLVSLLLSLPLLVRMFWMWEIPGTLGPVSLTDITQAALAAVVVFWFGRRFHANAYQAIRRGQSDMDTLISIGTLAAFGYSVYALFAGIPGYFESAATITALILLGRYLESLTKRRASLALRHLLELNADQATVIAPDGTTEERPLESIRIGETLLVRAGEKIPLDGLVTDGTATVDESLLTGEPMPALKSAGDKVFAGTIDQDGRLTVRVEKDGQGTLLAQIITTVANAQAAKAPLQRLADKIAAIFVPVVIAIAAATFTGWYLYTGNAGISLIHAVAVLVISCPCALGIATPIAVLVGSSVGARRGLLIKNGESFERATKVDTVILDKTGTLTMGKPKVLRLEANPDDDLPDGRILELAAALSGASTHPLSRSVAAYANGTKATPAPITEFREIPGRGVAARCVEHGAPVFLGNLSLLKDNHLDTAWAVQAGRHLAQGQTILYLAHGERTIAAFVLADELKATAKAAIDRLKRLGVTTMIVSGDQRDSVASVATALGIDRFIAGVLPTEKAVEVLRLKNEGRIVAFAGDGINDAPALAAADLSLAMASGADIAKETGDIVILKNDPIGVAEAIGLARRTFAAIKGNLFWAFFYNVLAIPLAAFGLVNPMIAALAMGLSDVTVIANSLRLYRYK